MDRTQRLFALMDGLRRHRRPVTAAALAQEQRVSVRTIYRDIRILIGLGAPIDGEAGVGYLLRPGFFLPPLMFDEDELEALVLGARWVEGQQDEALANAARNALGKIATAAPDDLREVMAQSGLWAHGWNRVAPAVSLPSIRAAIRREHKLRIAYRDQAGAATDRIVWPIGLAFYENRHALVAWCELREDFRFFRADRITELSSTGERYPKRRTALAKAFQEQMGGQESRRSAEGFVIKNVKEASPGERETGS
jgi:predicted DNA-binding transcriptional regulator YafY